MTIYMIDRMAENFIWEFHMWALRARVESSKLKAEREGIISISIPFVVPFSFELSAREAPAAAGTMWDKNLENAKAAQVFRRPADSDVEAFSHCRARASLRAVTEERRAWHSRSKCRPRNHRRIMQCKPSIKLARRTNP